MCINVGIEEGRIVVTQPVPSGRWVFEDESGAVDLIAEKACEDGEAVDFAPSCDSATQNGRPGFTKTAFLDRIQDAIYDINAASAPRM